MLFMMSVFFPAFVSSMHPMCIRVIFDIADRDPVAATLGFLDKYNLPADVVQRILTHFDYLLLHEILWTKIQHGNKPEWYDNGRLLRDKIKQLSSKNPSIEDAQHIFAIGTDMRALPQYHFDSHMPRALQHFDYPSLFKLDLENNPFRGEPGGKNFAIVLDRLLREKFVGWLRLDMPEPMSVSDDWESMVITANKMEPNTLSTTNMEILSHEEGLARVFEGLSELPKSEIHYLAGGFDYYALERLNRYISEREHPSQLVSAVIEQWIPYKRRVFSSWLRSLPPGFTSSKENTRKLFVALRTVPLDGVGLLMSELLQMRSTLYEWHATAYRRKQLQPLAMKHKLYLSSQYTVESIILQDLQFLRDTLLGQSLSLASDVAFIFHDMENVQAIFDEVRLLDKEAIQRTVKDLPYHDLFKLQQVNPYEDAQDAQTYNILDAISDQAFDSWIKSGEMNVYDLATHPILLHEHVLPSNGWNALGDESDVFFDPTGVRLVYDRILQRPRFHQSPTAAAELRFLDYFSLLALKHTIPTSGYDSPLRTAIDMLLPARTVLWISWMDKHGLTIVNNKLLAHRLIRALRFLPADSVPISLESVIQLMTNMRKWIPMLRSSHIVTRSGPQTQDSLVVQELFVGITQKFSRRNSIIIQYGFRHKQTLVDFIYCLQELGTNQIRAALGKFDYNHIVAFLYVAFKHRASQILQNVLSSLILNDPKSHYHRLEPTLLLRYMEREFDDGSVGRLLFSLPYLALLQFEQSVPLSMSNSFLQRLYAHIILSKQSWLHWYKKYGSLVIADRAEMQKLLVGLLLVPRGQLLLTPPGISELGDRMRMWYPHLARLRGLNADNALLETYAKFIAHTKTCIFFRMDNDIEPPDKLYRNHIWMYEGDANRNGALDFSVQFDKEVLTTHRRDVHDAINWPRVRSATILDSSWRVPNGLRKDDDGKFIFLLGTNDGLPPSWFVDE